jgi:hypothetical protein
VLAVPPVSEAALTEITRDVLGGEPDENLVALARASRGNLVELIEMLADGMRSGAFVADAGRIRLSGHAMPRRLDEAVGVRLSGLSPDARRVVDVAAVLGRTFRLDDVTALLDRPASQLVAEVREVFTARLFVDTGATAAFPHDLVRRAVLDRLPETLRRALNRDVALHLLRGGAPAVEVAPYVLAGTTSDPRVSVPLVEAAERLLVAAPGTAADLYQRALEFAVFGSRQWLSLVAPAARALAYGGRLLESERLLNTALDLGLDVTAEADVRLALAESMWLRGRGLDLIETLRPVMDHADLPTRMYARMRAAYAALLAPSGKAEDALTAADDAIAAARTVGDDVTLSDALATGSIVLRFLGDLDRSLA